MSNGLEARFRPPGHLLLLGWIFFVILPGVLLWTALQRGIAQEREGRKISQNDLLLQEMGAFVKDLETPSFLERRLGAAVRKVWKGLPRKGSTFLAPVSPLKAAALRKQVERSAGFPILGIFWHGPDTDGLWSDVSSEWKGAVPRQPILQILKNASGQDLRRGSDGSPPPREALDEDKAEARRDRERQRAMGYQTSILGDVSRVVIRPWIPIAMMSRSFGGGRLFAFYALFTAGTGRDAPVRGGCLVVVRERDLDPARILRACASRPLFPEVRRSWRWSEPEAAAKKLRDKDEALIFREDGLGKHLFGRPGQWYLGLLTGGGGFQATKGAECLELSVTITPSGIRHPFEGHIPWIRSALLTIGFLGSCAFGAAFLFGFSFPFRLRGKILVGAVTAGFLPIVLLLFGILLQGSVERERNRETVRARLELRQALLDRMLRGFLIELNYRLLEISRGLEGSVGTIASLSGALRKSCRGLPVSELLGIAADDGDFRLRFSVDPMEAWPKTMCDAFREMARAYILGMRASSDKKKKLMVYGLPLETSAIGSFLARPGRVSVFQLGPHDQLLAGLPIGSGTRSGAVVFRFNPEAVLETFLKMNSDLMETFQEGIGSWKLGTAVLKLDRANGTRLLGAFWKPGDGDWRKLLPMVRSSISRGMGFSISGKWNRRETLAAGSPVPFFPCLLFSWATASQADSLFPITAGGAAYFLFLLLTVVVLMGRVFSSPISELERVAVAVEKGEYPERIAISGGDELGGVGKAFGEMVQGLRHRDELSRFVSDEVLEVVQARSDGALDPGGELTEVTALFASLRGFRDWFSDAPGEAVIEVLNLFFSEGERVISANGGSLDKLHEETLMAVFRPRPGKPHHSWGAVRTALELQEALSSIFRGKWEKFAVPPVCDIGIATGQVLSGRIGSKHGQLDFSVIGNAVNLAARFKVQAKKASETGILVAPSTIRALGGKVRLRFLERTAIKGRSRSFPLYEVLSLFDHPPRET